MECTKCGSLGGQDCENIRRVPSDGTAEPGTEAKVGMFRVACRASKNQGNTAQKTAKQRHQNEESEAKYQFVGGIKTTDLLRPHGGLLFLWAVKTSVYRFRFAAT